MSEELLIEIMMLTFKTIALMAMPMICTVVVVGILSQVIQTVTQLKDMALSFVPKAITAGVVFIICVPWYFQISQHFTETIFNLISTAAR